MPSYTVKVFGLCCHSAGRYEALGKVKRTTVYGCYLISLLIVKKENRKGAKAISRGPKIWAANYFHYDLINTSMRIGTSSVIGNGLFDMPRPRESCAWDPGDR